MLRLLFCFYFFNYYVFGFTPTCGRQSQSVITSITSPSLALVITSQDHDITTENNVIGTETYWEMIRLWKTRIAEEVMPGGEGLCKLYINLPVYIGPRAHLLFVLHDRTRDENRMIYMHQILENLFDGTGVTIQLISFQNLPDSSLFHLC